MVGVKKARQKTDRPIPFLLILAFLCGWTGCGVWSGPSGPNVVVVMIDTLRPDHLGFYGYPRNTAPFLNRLAKRSAVFERAFATSTWTAPSTASLFTGFYPTRHGVVQGFLAEFDNTGEVQEEDRGRLQLNRLPPGLQTLPEHFQKAGYETFGLATNINIGPEIGFDRGFDRFERLDNVPALKVREKLRGWISAIQSAAPYFLYLHFNDVHAPYHPRSPWFKPSDNERERFISAYNSEISYLDSILQMLFVELKMNKNTLFVVLSDHGEEFLEHGGFDHEFSLYRELNQVALMIRGPDLGIPRRRIKSNVCLIDLLPTLLELAGLEAAAPCNGRSLVPLLAEEKSPPEFLDVLEQRPLYAHRLERNKAQSRQLWAVMRGGWKLLDDEGKLRLFDLDRDRFDLNDLADKHPEITEELREVLERFKAQGIDNPGGTTEVQIDGPLIERLRELGYIK
jgi:arylsulfatase A-like enzyme